MAVELVVEDGTIVPGANTYVSLAEATALISIDPHLAPIWDVMEEDDQNQMLAYASRWIDENHIWYGRPVSMDQPMRWPRCGMHDGEFWVPSTVIPEALRKAVAYAAVWLRANNPTDAAEAVGIKRFRNDTIEIEWQDGASQGTVPVWMARLLRVFGTGPGDRGFKPITRVN
jgi:hypothetical protein